MPLALTLWFVLYISFLTMDKKDRSVGPLVRKLRLERNMTQDQLAWKTDLSRSYIQHLENGRTHDLKVSTMVRLCEGLGLTVQDFFSRKEAMSMMGYGRNMATATPDTKTTGVHVVGAKSFSRHATGLFDVHGEPTFIRIQFHRPILKGDDSEALKEAVREHHQAHPRDVQLDLSKVDLLDSSVVSAILFCQKILSRTGHGVTLVAVQGPLKSLLEKMALAHLCRLPAVKTLNAWTKKTKGKDI